MITNLIYFFRRLFGKENIDDYGHMPTYSDVSDSPARRLKKKSIITSKKLSPNNINTSIKHNNSKTLHSNSNIIPKKKSSLINKSVLMRKIKTNIFFLEQLLEALASNESYRSYYRKVREMKEQSEGCFKLVHRIKDDAPYCQNTLKAILNHTTTIAQLLEIK